MKKRIIIFVVLLSLLILISLPVAYAETLHFRNTIASSYERVYAIKEDGTLYYWGKAAANEQAADQSKERLKPMPLLTDVINVYAGWGAGFAIRSDNSLWLIGSGGNIDGERKKSTDAPIKIMDNVRETANSYNRYLALKTDGTVWEWGSEFEKAKKIMDDVKHIGAGIGSFYAVKNDGTLWGWEENYSGALGVKTKEPYVFWWAPIKIMDDVQTVYGAGSNAFAIKTDGTLWGWGSNNDILMNKGVLETHLFTFSDGSQGSNEACFTPVKIMSNVKKISGINHITVIKDDNSLWTWGRNDSGELGDGTSISRYTMEKVLDDVADVTSYLGFTIALKEDGSLWGCGTNAWGELGLGEVDYDKHPKMIKITDKIALPNAIFHVPTSWAKEDVINAINLGLVPDECQSLYQQDIKRKEFVKLISELINKTATKNLKPIKDVYFADTDDKDVLNVARLGIIDGVGNNLFNPDGKITREQAATILMRTARLLNLSSAITDKKFNDNNSISEWATKGVYYCYANEIMNGTGDNNFSPSQTYSREMSIVTIFRLYNKFIK